MFIFVRLILIVGVSFLALVSAQNEVDRDVVKRDSPIIVEEFGEWQAGVTDLLKSVLFPGQTYFEWDPMTGHNFYKIAAHLESVGLAFGMIQDKNTYDKLSAKGYYTDVESLLATGYIDFQWNGSTSTVDSLVVRLVHIA
jgi:hypothetical protein